MGESKLKQEKLYKTQTKTTKYDKEIETARINYLLFGENI